MAETSTDGDDTILTFTHRGLGVGNATGFRPGTHAYLDRLAALLDGGRLPDWGRRFAELEPAYAAADPVEGGRR